MTNRDRIERLLARSLDDEVRATQQLNRCRDQVMACHESLKYAQETTRLLREMLAKQIEVQQ